MIWPGEEVINVITKNVDEIMAHKLEREGFKKNYLVIENKFEWRFEKNEEGVIKAISLRTTYVDSIVVEFWINKMPPGNSFNINKLMEDNSVSNEIIGYRFSNEQELKILLYAFIDIIEKKGLEKLDKL